jgi:indolepyruvate ferredoxin oxidoreductase alpha subunit
MRDARFLLGDEAVALGAVHAGLSAAYGYPGTPSTEILETLLAAGRPHAAWCANEKTAYEAALGVSLAGRRAMVAMKHVGLNVAADPFVNSALVEIGGGLVVAVADDPGMHSSQNEQDSRVLADFARLPCLEPADAQEAYAMTREAFDLSERFHLPVLLRLVTRLAHGRSRVVPGEPRPENVLSRPADPARWILLPGNARRAWRGLLHLQPELRAWAEASPWNPLSLNHARRELGVITTGIARAYYAEVRPELAWEPSHLHVGAYPFPLARIRALASHVQAILVLEEGPPYLERHLRGLLGGTLDVRGKESDTLPPDGELDADLVRRALGLPARPSGVTSTLGPIVRPPQLCQGCPHRDVFAALEQALTEHPGALVTSDIGCYTLGALPPFETIQSCVCMGASIGMARGAADAGVRPAVAVIGDSTFLHSGVTPLMDAVAAGADVLVIVLDNGTVAMTGTQPTILPGPRIEAIAEAVGLPSDRVHVIEPHPRRLDALAALLRQEIARPGPGLVVCRRECLEAARRRKTSAAAQEVAP